MSEPRKCEPQSRWSQWRRAIIGTFGAIGIWIAAIMAVQGPAAYPVMPIQQVSAREWVFTNEYAIAVSNIVITIRPPFKTDFCSIPSPTQDPLGLKPDSPSVRRGGAAHDALYALLDSNGNGEVSKDMADACLELLLLTDGTEPAKARAMREAVSLYGFAALRLHTPESVAKARRLVTVTAR